MPHASLAFIAPSRQAIQFAIKTLLGAGLALWCAMRFGLEQPVWAMMTAFIVAQPLSGMVVQKGLARMVGTLIGTIMSVAFIGLFAQTPWVFIGALAVWLAMCTASSTMLRSAWSYSFVLAGYTVAIIGLPAVGNPLTVFDQAVARCTEISLGILCATAASAIIWPQRVEVQLIKQANVAWRAGLNAASLALAQESHARQGLLQVLGHIVAVDSQREHAWFEGSRGRQRAAALRVLSRDLLSMLRLARGVGRQLRQLSAQERECIEPLIIAAREQFDMEQMSGLDELAERVRLAALSERLNPAQQICLERLLLLVTRMQVADQSLHAVEQGVAPRNAPDPLSWHSDWQTALIYGARSALAFLAFSAFWMATGWTFASGGILMTAVVCSLFASRDNAAQIGMMFLRGIFYAIPVAFVVGELVLPQLSSFAMLCLAMGVPLFFAALGMCNPAMGATSTSFALHFILLCSPQNQMNFSVTYFLNTSQALIMGVGFAVLAFKLISIRSPRWLGSRLLDATLNDLRRLTRRPLNGAENWFGGRIADRLLQLARHYPALPDATRTRWDDGIASLDLGDELLHLRACLEAGDKSVGIAEQHFLQQLDQQLGIGPAPERGQVLDEAVDELLQALNANTSSIDRRLARAALLQLQLGWKNWCAHKGEQYGLA